MLVSLPSQCTTHCYHSLKSENTSSIKLFLRDCVDFRPAVNTSGTTPSRSPRSLLVLMLRVPQTIVIHLTVVMVLLSPYAYPGTQVRADLEFYLPKYDSLFLDTRGALILAEGASATNPVPPVTPSNALRLYDFYCPPYTFRGEAHQRQEVQLQALPYEGHCH